MLGEREIYSPKENKANKSFIVITLIA